MATTYVVFEENPAGRLDGADEQRAFYAIVGRFEASTPTQARRLAAETMPDDAVDIGVVLHAVPARNWDGGRGKEQAETTRRIRSA